MVLCWNKCKELIGDSGCLVYGTRGPGMALTLAPLRRRGLLVLLVAVFVPCGVLVLLSGPGEYPRPTPRPAPRPLALPPQKRKTKVLLAPEQWSRFHSCTYM
ncbi:hypothetical protein R5R35_012417 [Gryllus longicercus]|uniref:Uncharacterized protein n=1 Tax=Gryllus longicercus TaxID=2509291 RepID=A0AAN9Z7H8_9ORTH